MESRSLLHLSDYSTALVLTFIQIFSHEELYACLGACKIGLHWSINGVLIETFPLAVGSRAEGGVASKLGNETRLMAMKGGNVLDSVKMLACMLGGCNIGLQWY